MPWALNYPLYAPDTFLGHHVLMNEELMGAKWANTSLQLMQASAHGPALHLASAPAPELIPLYLVEEGSDQVEEETFHIFF
ncbi:hypothetical protein EW146_g8201 [Bondarzewia mesenterica]|uniref:Uncharacterized protein n=1 Tax=Bondarzewia mesenterica TaxID=1095465 RepID=A0A4S4LGC4_9AGAM|nr:hypothetical protein EW146_g8201 [Bondarzewia mesenterica]